MSDLNTIIEQHFPIARAKLTPELVLYSVSREVNYPIKVTNDNIPYALAYWHSQALAREILDNPTVFFGKKTLDIGCGTGVAAIAAAKVGADSYALDPDLRCLAMTEKNAELNKTKVNLVWGDHSTTFEPDIVLAGGVFHDYYAGPIIEKARSFPSLIAVSKINLWNMLGFEEVRRYEITSVVPNTTIIVFKSKHLQL
jgi:predicted nicotinamide N-methyase